MNQPTKHTMTNNGRAFFIVGCGRSGTTFLRSLLTRDPRIAIPLESLFIVDYLQVGSEYPLDQIRQWIVEEPELGEWGIRPTPSDLASAKDVASVIRALHEIYAAKQGKQVWGQKTPRFIRHLSLLQENFPEAVFIHLVRDPRAVVNSLMRSDVHRSTTYHGAKRWQRDVSAGLSFAAQHPGAILQLSYEDLVNDPEGELAKIYAHIDLDFPEDLLERKADSLADYSDFYENIHANLDRPPIKSNIDKWRHSLSNEQIQFIEALCQELMMELEYQPIFSNKNPSRFQIFRDEVVRALRIWQQLWRYLRYRRHYFFHLLRRKIRLGLIKDFLGTINQ